MDACCPKARCKASKHFVLTLSAAQLESQSTCQARRLYSLRASQPSSLWRRWARASIQRASASVGCWMATTRHSCCVSAVPGQSSAAPLGLLCSPSPLARLPLAAADTSMTKMPSVRVSASERFLFVWVLSGFGMFEYCLSSVVSTR